MQIENIDGRLIKVVLDDKTMVVQRGVLAIIEVVKHQRKIKRSGYCKAVKPLVGMTSEVVSRCRTQNKNMAASQILKVHRLSGLPIADIYALDLQECNPIALQEDVVERVPDAVCGYWLTVNDGPANYHRDHVDAFLGALTTVCQEPKHIIMGELDLSIYRVSQQRRLSNIPAPWILKAHLYTGLKLSELSKLEAL
jgi:hypothetical protein